MPWSRRNERDGGEKKEGRKNEGEKMRGGEMVGEKEMYTTVSLKKDQIQKGTSI